MSYPNYQQTFQGGMVQDIDPHLQPPNTYRDADNGQLLYNTDEQNPTMGHGMAFSNTRGNRYATAVPPGYLPIGDVDCSKGTLVFSTNNVNSEIGLWVWDTDEELSGTYYTLYNDDFDPNVKNVHERLRHAGDQDYDRLNWNWQLTDKMDVQVAFEDERTERVYWTDRQHAIHTFDLVDAYTPAGGSWHETVMLNPLRNTYYPKHWSIHAFRERADLVFPRIKFLGRCKGRCMSGAYQIGVLYRHKNGHESVWSPLTRRVFVTTNPLDDDNAARQAGLRSNHHNRVMAPSGKMSTEGLRWELDGLDVRWESVRVAVLYFESPEKPFKRVALKPITIGTTGRLVIEITQLEGEELTDSVFVQRYDNVIKAGTLAASDNMLISGNLTFLEPINMDDKLVKFDPLLRSMSADETGLPAFVKSTNPISNRDDNDPITNTAVRSATLETSAFSGVANKFTVTDDYLNYKGQVFDWLFKGYFRGETYEYGALVLDRSGQPMFVQPLPQFTFPEQYAPGPNGEKDYYSLTKLNPATGRFDLQIMGVKISGLALPVDRLYDQDGRLNVSGFMIVRRKRNIRVKHQGVLFPVCRVEGCFQKDRSANKLLPLATTNNAFAMTGAGDRFLGPILHQCATDPSGPSLGPVSTERYYFTYVSPDVFIEESFEAIKAADVIKHVGVVNFSSNSQGNQELSGRFAHYYCKSYRTNTTAPRFADLAKNGRPNLGETTRLALGILVNKGYDETYKEFDKDKLLLEFETQAHPLIPKRFSANGYRPEVADSLLHRNCVLMKSKDWKGVDISESDPGADLLNGKYCSYRLANYVQAANEVSPEKEPYFATGHYQPISETVLGLAGRRYGLGGKLEHYVFDNIEVWGGDCYNNLFDFTRLYPYWSEGCEQRNGMFPDYSISHLLPIESKYNLALRWGRSFASHGTKPQINSCDSIEPQFNAAIMDAQPEDWKYNAVLTLEETVQFYTAQNPEQELISNRQNGFQWTPEKSSGQRLDAWRLRYVGNYGQADGNQGAITKLVAGSGFNGIYVWQERGFGVATLNASQYQTGDAGVIVVNTGRVFNGMIPLSKENGTQHPESVWVSKGQTGAWDARNGVLLRHSQAGLDELSKQESLHDLVQSMTANLGAADLNTLRQWRAVSGVHANGDVLTTFWHNQIPQKTIVYSPSIGAFTGSLPGMPRYYGRRGRYLFAADQEVGNKLFLHHRANYGEFFGKVYPTRLRFIVNPAPTQTKRFDNGFININQAGYSRIASIRHFTPNGGLRQDHTILGSDERMEWWDNVLAYPMYEWDWMEQKDALRDHYLVVEITIDNSANVPVEILSFGTSFLTS